MGSASYCHKWLWWRHHMFWDHVLPIVFLNIGNTSGFKYTYSIWIYSNYTSHDESPSSQHMGCVSRDHTQSVVDTTGRPVLSVLLDMYTAKNATVAVARLTAKNSEKLIDHPQWSASASISRKNIECHKQRQINGSISNLCQDRSWLVVRWLLCSRILVVVVVTLLRLCLLLLMLPRRCA